MKTLSAQFVAATALRIAQIRLVQPETTKATLGELIRSERPAAVMAQPIALTHSEPHETTKGTLGTLTALVRLAEVMAQLVAQTRSVRSAATSRDIIFDQEACSIAPPFQPKATIHHLKSYYPPFRCYCPKSHYP